MLILIMLLHKHIKFQTNAVGIYMYYQWLLSWLLHKLCQNLFANVAEFPD